MQIQSDGGKVMILRELNIIRIIVFFLKIITTSFQNIFCVDAEAMTGIRFWYFYF